MNAKPKLRIGIPGDYLPFGIINEDSPLGFAGHDVDLAAELCREAGLAPLFVLTTWPTFMTDLAEGRFDIAAGGVSWVPERARLTDALPRYAPFAKVALIRRDSIERFQTPEDLNQPDVRVIKNPGGTNERWVDANLTRAQVATVADNATIPARIANEVGDVMITDSFAKASARHPNGPSRPPSESPPKARNANNRNRTSPGIRGLFIPPPPN